MATIETSHGPDGLPHHRYGRTTHQAADVACGTLAMRYGPTPPTVILTPTGNAAVNLAITALARQWRGEIHFVYGRCMYADSHRSLHALAQENDHVSLHDHPVDSMDKAIPAIKSLRGKQIVLFAESCSNPKGQMLAPELCALVEKEASTYHILIDNTVLTSSRFNPFVEYRIPGKNITVLSSASKHYSAGNTMGGFIATHNSKLRDRIHRMYYTRGYHVHPVGCRAILQAVDSMDARVEASTKATRAILDRLAETLPPKVEIEHASVYRQKAGASPGSDRGPYPDIFALKIPLRRGHPLTAATFHALITPLRTFRFVISYGGEDSRIDARVGDDWCRLRVSIGYGAETFDAMVTELLGVVRAILRHI